MEKSKITTRQMFCLMVLFELGSAIVIGLGTQAKQDAWLSILIGMVGGLILYLMYGYLFKSYPSLPLTVYLEKILGRYLGKLLAMLYIAYFVYLAARVLRDFGDLISSTILEDTPLIAINLLIVLFGAYVICQGIETLAKAGEFLLIILMGILTLTIFLIFASGLPKVENLLPVLGDGLMPVLKTAFPLTLTFPFGEMVVFTMLLPYLNEPNQGLKTGLTAMVFSGVVLSFVMAINVSVIGPATLANHYFPFLRAVSQINIAETIQRLDSLAIISLVIGGFFKIGIFTYAAVLGLTELFRPKKTNVLVYLVSGMVLAGSIWVAGNFVEHLEIGLKMVPYYLHLPLQVGIPLILTCITFIRKRV